MGEDEEAETSTLANKSLPSKSPSNKKFAPLLATSGSAKKSKMTRQKRKAMSKKRVGMKRIEVPEDILKDAQPINDSVQKMADKLKLHRTQVKGILKALYEVPELLDTARQQAG